MSVWLAESLRCTVFPREPGSDVAGFGTAMGVDPDRVDAQPKLGIVRESAVLDNGATTVTLERFPPLAHFRIGTPPDARLSTGADLPTLANANEVFLERVQVWLPALPPLSRLAYGAIVLLPVVSRIEGYEVLDRLLPDVRVDSVGSEDFRFQINRPREIEFGAEVLRINRLTKWSVRRMQLLSGGPPSAMAENTIEEEFHIMLDLDVNTVPGAGVLPVDTEGVIGLFQTLVGIGVEITEKGDVP